MTENPQEHPPEPQNNTHQEKNSSPVAGSKASNNPHAGSVEDTWLDISEDDDDEIHDLAFQAHSGSHQKQQPADHGNPSPDMPVNFESPANPFFDPGLTDGRRRRDMAITFDDLEALPGPVSLKAAIDSGSLKPEELSHKGMRSTYEDMVAVSYEVPLANSMGQKISVAKDGSESYYYGVDKQTEFDSDRTHPQMELSTQGTSPGSPSSARSAANSAQGAAVQWSEEEANARKFFISSERDTPKAPSPPAEETPVPEARETRPPSNYIDPELYWQSNSQKMVRHGAYIPYSQTTSPIQVARRTSLLDENEDRLSLDAYRIPQPHGAVEDVPQTNPAPRDDTAGGVQGNASNEPAVREAESKPVEPVKGEAAQQGAPHDAAATDSEDGLYSAREEDVREQSDGSGSNQMTLAMCIIICCIAVGAAAGNVIHSVISDDRPVRDKTQTKTIEAVEVKKDSPKWLQTFNKALEYERKGEFDDALRLFSLGLNTEDKQSELWHGRGRVLTKQKQFVRAENDLKKALELAPNHLGVQIDLAALYYYKDDFEEAAKVYTDIVEKAPDETDCAIADAYYGRALCRLKLGKSPLAVKDLEKALKLRPSYAKACQQLAAIYIEQGDLEKAIGILSAGIDQAADCPELYFERGLAKYKSGSKEDALSDYREAIKLNPGNKNFYNDRGFVLLDLGRYDEAIRDFRMSLEIDPDYALAKENLRVATNALEKKGSRTE